MTKLTKFLDSHTVTKLDCKKKKEEMGNGVENPN